MIDEKVNKIASIVFGIPLDQINDEISPEKNDEWDSLQHMSLVSEIEKEFKITFSVDEAVSIKDLKSIKEMINQKLENAQ